MVVGFASSPDGTVLCSHLSGLASSDHPRRNRPWDFLFVGRFPAADMDVWNLVGSLGNRSTPLMFSAVSTWHAGLVRTFEGRFRGFQDVPDRLVRSDFSHLPNRSHSTGHHIILSDALRSRQILSNVLRYARFCTWISPLGTDKYPMEYKSNEMCLISIIPSKIRHITGFPEQSPI